MSGSRCRTLYPFSGERHGQGLRFAAGEVIALLQVPDGGWWEGEKEDGSRGWFPASYVQLLEVSAGRAGWRGGGTRGSVLSAPSYLLPSARGGCSWRQDLWGTRDPPLAAWPSAPTPENCQDSPVPSRHSQRPAPLSSSSSTPRTRAVLGFQSRS